jgi:hypothetical protein
MPVERQQSRLDFGTAPPMAAASVCSASACA